MLIRDSKFVAPFRVLLLVVLLETHHMVEYLVAQRVSARKKFSNSLFHMCFSVLLKIALGLKAVQAEIAFKSGLRGCVNVADVSAEITFHGESQVATRLFAGIGLLVVMDPLMLLQRSGLDKSRTADVTKKVIGG